MNTGVQRSGATPPAARTADHAGRRRRSRATSFGQGKSAPLIAMAHEIPYVATATVADLRDLEAKVERAMELRGARYLHILVTCPLGWGSAVARLDPGRAARHGDRAVPGLRGRGRRGHRRLEDPPPGARSRSTCELAAALRAPVRARARATTSSRSIQARADRNIERFGLRGTDGQALRHHARRRLEPRQQDRPLAHRAPGLRRPPAAVQQRLPGRREHPGVALPRRGGRLRDRLAAAHGGQPVARPSWDASATTRARPPATAASSTRRSASTRSSASSATRRSSRAGRVEPLAAPSRQARARRRRGPVRAVGRLPPRAPRPRSRRSATPARSAGGMMRFGIPRYRLPREVLDAEIQRILDLGVELELDSKVADLEARCARAASTPPSSPSARTSASARTSRRARRRRSSTPSRCCAAWRARSRRCSAAASSSTAAATRRSTPRAPPSASGRRRRSSSTGARATGCPPTTSRSRRRSRRACSMKWLSTIKHVDDGRLVVERMELDETGFPQPTGELEELEADSLVLALGQEADLSLLDGVPGVEIDDGVVQVGPEHDDRPRRDLRRRRHGPRRAHRHRRRSATASRRRATSTRWLRGALRAPAARPSSPTFDTLNTWYYADAPRPSARSSTSSAASRPSTRSSAASTRTPRSSRRAAACRAATASPATTATASAPTTP